MDMRKRLKGGDVDWKHLEFRTKEMRAISEAKIRDLIKMLPLVCPEPREYLEKFVDLPRLIKDLISLMISMVSMILMRNIMNQYN